MMRAVVRSFGLWRAGASRLAIVLCILIHGRHDIKTRMY